MTTPARVRNNILGIVDRLDSLICMLQNKRLPDRIHVDCLRQSLPEVARELREKVEEL